MAFNKIDNKNYGPFKLWTIQNFPFIEEDFDAITNYQLYSKIVEHMKKLQNANNELISAFNNLVNYVNNYFETLDVQEEVNNKLDEMAESGELEEIIEKYLQSNAYISYNTLTELIASTNLFDGMTIRTLGELNYLDGKGRIYRIREKEISDVVDNINIFGLTNYEDLIAELIPEELYSSIEEITEYISGINEGISGINESISGINESISGINESISGINSSVETINTDIENINTDMENINTDIENNTNDIGEIQNTLNKKKKMLLFGDSWSMPNYPHVTNQDFCWYNNVAKFLNADLYNYAQSGAGFLVQNNDILTQVNSAISNIENPEEIDYVFVEGGYNDLNFTDNLDFSTITTKVKNTINAISSVFNKAQIFLLTVNTPYKLLKGETGTLTQMYNTYCFYQYFMASVVLCDSVNITSINMIPMLLGFSDAVNNTLHPNDKGMHILSRSIISALNGNYSRQTTLDNNIYTPVDATGSQNPYPLVNTKNIYNTDYAEIIFTLTITNAVASDTLASYYLDELPLVYLPDGFSISSDGKKTVHYLLTTYNGRNLLQIQLPAGTQGTFDINFKIPLV